MSPRDDYYILHFVLMCAVVQLALFSILIYNHFKIIEAKVYKLIIFFGILVLEDASIAAL